MSDIDLQGALSSPSLGFKYYINYYYQGNTCGISPSEIGQIQSTWSDKLPVWKNYVENVADENVYDIDEDDYNDAMKRGTEYGKDLTGYENNGWDKTKQQGRVILDAGNTVVHGAGVIGAGGISALGNAGGSLLGKTAGEATKQTAGEALKEGTSKASGFLIVSCAIDLAMAALYWFATPNKKQYEALMDINGDMGNQQGMLDNSVYEIEDMDAELRALNDEANTLVEESNQQMAEDKVNYDYSRDTIEYFNRDIGSGYRVTGNDVAAYQAALQYMRESGASIAETQENTQTRMGEITFDMGSYEAGFDDAINTIGEVEGFTNYAEGFDEATKAACTTEQIMQYFNMAFAIMDVARCVAKIAVTCGWGVAIYGAAMLMAGAAAFMDYRAAAQQGKWAKEIGAEIEARKVTQEMQTNSYSTYNEYIDYYGGYMTDVGSLTLEVPEEMAPPPDTGVPTPAGGGSGDGDGGKKKKEE